MGLYRFLGYKDPNINVYKSSIRKWEKPILSALSASVGKSSKLSNGIPTNVFFNYGFERTQMSV